MKLSSYVTDSKERGRGRWRETKIRQKDCYDKSSMTSSREITPTQWRLFWFME